jgi:hypothetical protein
MQHQHKINNKIELEQERLAKMKYLCSNIQMTLEKYLNINKKIEQKQDKINFLIKLKKELEKIGE